MFTTTDLEELAQANEKRQALNGFLRERALAWADLNGLKKPPATFQGYAVNPTVRDADLFNPTVTNLTIAFDWHDGVGINGGQVRIVVPKEFVFDTDGIYETKFRQYKRLQAELGLNDITK